MPRDIRFGNRPLKTEFTRVTSVSAKEMVLESIDK